jgi:hypothetical protein
MPTSVLERLTFTYLTLRAVPLASELSSLLGRHHRSGLRPQSLVNSRQQNAIFQSLYMVFPHLLPHSTRDHHFTRPLEKRHVRLDVRSFTQANCLVNRLQDPVCRMTDETAGTAQGCKLDQVDNCIRKRKRRPVPENHLNNFRVVQSNSNVKVVEERMGETIRL